MPRCLQPLVAAALAVALASGCGAMAAAPPPSVPPPLSPPPSLGVPSVGDLHVVVATPEGPVRLAPRGQLLLWGAALPPGVAWRGAALRGERTPAGWRIDGGVIALSDGGELEVRDGTLLEVVDANGAVSLVARLRAAAPPVPVAATPPPPPPPPVAVAPAPPSPPPPPPEPAATFRHTSITRYGSEPTACYDGTLTLRADIDPKDVETTFALVGPTGATLTAPIHRERDSDSYCVDYQSLPLRPGRHELIGHLRAVHRRTKVVLGELRFPTHLDIPVLYAVRIRVPTVETTAIASFSDVAAVFTLCLTCVVAPPHGTTELFWSIDAGRYSFVSRVASTGLTMTSREATKTFVVAADAAIDVTVSRKRRRAFGLMVAEVVGRVRLTPVELAGVLRDHRVLTAGHVQALHLDGSEVRALNAP